MLKKGILICVLSSYFCSVLSNLIFYEEGESATLDCTGEGDVQFWLLKGGGDAIEKTTAGDVYMHQNGSLEFDLVNKTKHEGNHLCVTRIEEKLRVTQVNMVVKPLPPQNLWEYRYKRMFTIGFISSLICFLIFAGGCLVNRYKWVDPTPKVDKSRLVEQEAYSNPAMQQDEDPDTINIKM